MEKKQRNKEKIIQSGLEINDFNRVLKSSVEGKRGSNLVNEKQQITNQTTVS